MRRDGGAGAAVVPRGGVGGTCGGAGARPGDAGAADGRRLADVAQHELEAADLALDGGGRRAARGVLARERQLVGLRVDGGEALAQVADDLAERLGELDVRADRAVEKLLGDGADLRADLARVGRLRPLGLGDHDARGRGARRARASS